MTPNTNTMGMGIMGGMGFNNGSSNQSNNDCYIDVVAAAQQYVGKSKIILDKLKAKHEIALVKIQLMDVIKYSIESEENYLRKENY